MEQKIPVRIFFMWIKLVEVFSQKFQAITEIETAIFDVIESIPVSPPEIPGIKLNGTIIPNKKVSNIWLFPSAYGKNFVGGG